MILMLRCDGIIFDVDGTLWDSTDICALGFNRAIERLLGKDYPKTNGDQLKKLFGKTTAGIGAGLFRTGVCRNSWTLLWNVLKRRWFT